MRTQSAIRVLLVSSFMGRKQLVGPLCYVARKHRVDAIVLLGDTVSPVIPARLTEYCRVKLFSVLGVFDEASVASTLKNTESLVECRYMDIGGFIVYGYGMSGCNPRLEDTVKVDLLLSVNPRATGNCCRDLWEPLSRLLERVRPRVIAIGGCLDPCREENIVSPGSLTRGYLAILEITQEGFSFKPTSIYGELDF